MKKPPSIIIFNNLILPIAATEKRITEIKEEVKQNATKVSLNGLFLMLVSYIESMQKEILKYFLKYRPDKIPDKTIKLNTDSLTAYENFHFIEDILEEYLDKIQHWQLSEYFYETLNIEPPTNESKIKAIKFKRNHIIHHNTRINYKHKEIDSDSVDSEYILNCAFEYEEYLSHLKSEIITQYASCTKINALKRLWYYTFTTPLCANFSDYWYVDEKNDLIVGCKFPTMGDSLSSSEKFLLDIWRSQVCNRDVKFLNMASLDLDSQNCLYMFLKLSNDIFMYS